jgi:hypothetical protein
MSKLTEQLEQLHRQMEVNQKHSEHQLAKLSKEKNLVEKQLRLK